MKQQYFPVKALSILFSIEQNHCLPSQKVLFCDPYIQFKRNVEKATDNPMSVLKGSQQFRVERETETDGQRQRQRGPGESVASLPTTAGFVARDGIQKLRMQLTR